MWVCFASGLYIGCVSSTFILLTHTHHTTRGYTPNLYCLSISSAKWGIYWGMPWETTPIHAACVFSGNGYKLDNRGNQSTVFHPVDQMGQVIFVNMKIHPGLSLPKYGMRDMEWQAPESEKDFITWIGGITTGDAGGLKIWIGSGDGGIW